MIKFFFNYFKDSWYLDKSKSEETSTDREDMLKESIELPVLANAIKEELSTFLPLKSKILPFFLKNHNNIQNLMLNSSATMENIVNPTLKRVIKTVIFNLNF